MFTAMVMLHCQHWLNMSRGVCFVRNTGEYNRVRSVGGIQCGQASHAFCCNTHIESEKQEARSEKRTTECKRART